MYLYHNIENDLVIDVENIYHRSQLIHKIKKKMMTFGYQEIHTSAFENYDLYVQMNGTVNQPEMIKSIDNTGNVLVLRPDVTIPLTEQIAQHNQEIHEDLRYFYVLDVFRQAVDVTDRREHTQAGVEYFGNSSPDADAEVIALSIQLMRDIKTDHVTIEIGHAGFFKQLIIEMNLEKQDLLDLKQYIQAKNVTEIEQLLQRLAVDKDIKKVVTSLPFLYGNPKEVIEKAKALPLNEKMLATLDNLSDIYHGLEAYEVHQHIVVDLSLINHMDYYSDVIFQGFIENVGKPIVMGGRYDTLANQFAANIPAIGFACDLDLLMRHVPLPDSNITVMDLCICYDETMMKQGIAIANALRKQAMHIVTYPIGTKQQQIPSAEYVLYLKSGQYLIQIDGNKRTFSTAKEVIAYLADREM